VSLLLIPKLAVVRFRKRLVREPSPVPLEPKQAEVESWRERLERNASSLSSMPMPVIAHAQQRRRPRFCAVEGPITCRPRR